MKNLIFSLLLLAVSATAFAQSPGIVIQMHPADIGAFGGGAGDLLTVSPTPALGHVHITRANLAADLASIMVLGGDLSGTPGNAQIVSGAVGTTEIANGGVGSLDLAQMGATSGQVLEWNGSAWAPGTDGGDTYTAGSGIDITSGTISNTRVLSRTASTNNVAVSNGGGSATVSDYMEYLSVAFTPGTPTATITGTLPANPAEVVVALGGLNQRVGGTGCTTTCSVELNGNTLTFGRNLSSGEVIVVAVPKQ